MADISRLSRLVAGVQRGVDLQSNALVVGSLKVGSATPTELTKAILDNLDTFFTWFLSIGICKLCFSLICKWSKI